MSTEFFKITAIFQTENSAPVTGDQYTVCLRDKDRFFDDKLGRSKLDAEGRAEFIINAADILSIDSQGEVAPDLYFVIQKDGREIFRSPVYTEVDFRVKDPVTGRSEQLTKSFGPFRVETR